MKFNEIQPNFKTAIWFDSVWLEINLNFKYLELLLNQHAESPEYWPVAENLHLTQHLAQTIRLKNLDSLAS